MWLENNNNVNMTIIELGAGNGVPTVRHQSEQIVLRDCRNDEVMTTLIRINPTDQNLMIHSADRECLVIKEGDKGIEKLYRKNII